MKYEVYGVNPNLAVFELENFAILHLDKLANCRVFEGVSLSNDVIPYVVDFDGKRWTCDRGITTALPESTDMYNWMEEFEI